MNQFSPKRFSPMKVQDDGTLLICIEFNERTNKKYFTRLF